LGSVGGAALWRTQNKGDSALPGAPKLIEEDWTFANAPLQMLVILAWFMAPDGAGVSRNE
jgi:hypothetical protein